MAFKMFKKGASGGAVKDAQKALAKRLKTNIKGDGKFGPATEEHIKAFQKKSRLKADGLLGPKTMAALMPGATKPPPEQLKAIKKLKDQSAQARKAMGDMKKQIDDFDKLISKRDKRQMIATAFQNLDQSVNQSMQSVARILRSMKQAKDDAVASSERKAQ